MFPFFLLHNSKPHVPKCRYCGRSYPLYTPRTSRFGRWLDRHDNIENMGVIAVILSGLAFGVVFMFCLMDTIYEWTNHDKTLVQAISGTAGNVIAILRRIW